MEEMKGSEFLDLIGRARTCSHLVSRDSTLPLPMLGAMPNDLLFDTASRMPEPTTGNPGTGPTHWAKLAS